jgi:hypothetical protein
LNSSSLVETAIYRKSEAGKSELNSPTGLVHQRYRRALILLDGTKDLAEVSVLLRPGEIEKVVPYLLTYGMIEAIDVNDPEYPKGYVHMVPAARDPVRFAAIRDAAIERVREKIGEAAEMVVGEMEACETADEMRVKLRDLESIFASVLGDHEGAMLAREIGGELLSLIPRALAEGNA